MEHKDLIDTISFLRPEAKFVVRGTDIEWMDEDQTQPTDKEIKDGHTAYLAQLKKDADDAKTKREALLTRLGITAEEAALLLS
jgi:hypothetical protein